MPEPDVQPAETTALENLYDEDPKGTTISPEVEKQRLADLTAMALATPTKAVDDTPSNEPTPDSSPNPPEDGVVPDTVGLTGAGVEPTVDAKFDLSVLELPAGFESMDDTTLQHFAPMLQGREQKDAQELLNTFATWRTEDATRQKSDRETMRMQHATQLKNDPILGGENFENTKTEIMRAIDAHGLRAVSQLLRPLGLDQHPVYVRALQRLGANTRESVYVTPEGEQGSQGGDAFEDVMYDNTKSLT